MQLGLAGEIRQNMEMSGPAVKKQPVRTVQDGSLQKKTILAMLTVF
jgi:hypothetical protein